MNVNYEYYRIFYYVARYKSFTKAANVLYSNQPNVTRSMNKLEKQLGVKLFVRTNRGITLTPEGKQLYDHVKIAQEHLSEGEKEIMREGHLERGIVTIAVSETALNIFLLDKLATFHDKNSNIRIRIINHSTPAAVKALHQGQVDIALVTTPFHKDKSMKKTKLLTFNDIPVVGKQYKALADKVMSVRDLVNYPLVMLGRDTMTYEFYNQFFLDHGLVMDIDIEAATTDQVLPLVEHNLGIGFLPEPYAKEGIKKGTLNRIRLDEKIPEREVVLLQNTNTPLSAATDALAKTLVKKEG